MTWVNGIVVFLCVWWVVLFTVLPWGARPSANPEVGHERGAPEHPMLWRKVIITTALAAIIWLAIYLVVELELISFRDMVR